MKTLIASIQILSLLISNANINQYMSTNIVQTDYTISINPSVYGDSGNLGVIGASLGDIGISEEPVSIGVCFEIDIHFNTENNLYFNLVWSRASSYSSLSQCMTFVCENCQLTSIGTTNTTFRSYYKSKDFKIYVYTHLLYEFVNGRLTNGVSFLTAPAYNQCLANMVQYNRPPYNTETYLIGFAPSSYTLSQQTDTHHYIDDDVANIYTLQVSQNTTLSGISSNVSTMLGYINTIKSNTSSLVSGLTSANTNLSNIYESIDDMNDTLILLRGDLQAIQGAIDDLDINIDIVTNNNTTIIENWSEINYYNNEFNLYMDELFLEMDIEQPMFHIVADDTFQALSYGQSINDVLQSTLVSEDFINGGGGVIIGLPIICIILLVVLL